MSIQVKGPWAVAWFANIAFLYIMGVGGYAAHLLWGSDVVYYAVPFWVVWFAVQEFSGMWLSSGKTKDGQELAVTLSQVLQWFANMDRHHGGIHALTGWSAVVVGTTLAVASLVSFCVYSSITIYGAVLCARHGFVPWVPNTLAVVMAAWVFYGISASQYPHWINRGRHG